MVLLAALFACTAPVDGAGGTGDSGVPGDTSAPPGDTSAPADTADPEDTSDPEDSGEPPLTYDEGDGPYDVTTEDGKVSGQGVTWFSPRGLSAAPVVMWAHGFARSRAFHHDSARHAATWGLVVVTVDLPEPYGGHEANGAFLADELLTAALARPEADGRWAFVGHSAGGLAAVLAAAEVGADAVVGLDAVDYDDLGRDAARQVTAPTLRLVGEPSACNASGNGRDWSLGGTDWMVEVPRASHCDFESPTDTLCSAVCGSADSARQEVVGEYAAAWLVYTLLGGAEAWVEGAEAQADRQDGRIDYD
ncbi:MAG: hypothetical protein FJ090_18815 [Deltaproteobacteria bacterium]|nr:hypothetical protein [Deltaproteobacteria bacterium]